jgi:hypothetical protein
MLEYTDNELCHLEIRRQNALQTWNKRLIGSVILQNSPDRLCPLVLYSY